VGEDVDREDVKFEELAFEVDVASVVALAFEVETEDDELRDVAFAAVKNPPEVMKFVPEYEVDLELPTDVELACTAILIVLFKETEVMLAFVKVEKKAVIVAFGLEVLETCIDEKLKETDVKFKCEVVVETTAGGVIKFVKEMLVALVKSELDA
jgi:hypothetical protein